MSFQFNYDEGKCAGRKADKFEFYCKITTKKMSISAYGKKRICCMKKDWLNTYVKWSYAYNQWEIDEDLLLRVLTIKGTKTNQEQMMYVSLWYNYDFFVVILYNILSTEATKLMRFLLNELYFVAASYNVFMNLFQPLNKKK